MTKIPCQQLVARQSCFKVKHSLDSATLAPLMGVSKAKLENRASIFAICSSMFFSVGTLQLTQSTVVRTVRHELQVKISNRHPEGVNRAGRTSRSVL